MQVAILSQERCGTGENDAESTKLVRSRSALDAGANCAMEDCPRSMTKVYCDLSKPADRCARKMRNMNRVVPRLSRALSKKQKDLGLV